MKRKTQQLNDSLEKVPATPLVVSAAIAAAELLALTNHWPVPDFVLVSGFSIGAGLLIISLMQLERAWRASHGDSH